MVDAALGELADFCGIEPGYHDIWGVWREASSDTVRALLSAMGVALDGRADAEEVLRKLIEKRWSRVLPETVVLRKSALGQGVALRLPPTLRAGCIEWRVTEEGARAQEGAANLAQLELAEECEIAGRRRRAVLLALPALATGYHQLEISAQGRSLAAANLFVVPDRCYLPDGASHGECAWGIGLQLYGLRSKRNWGIGDFGDLAAFAAQWCQRGAAFVGVNPLHALYSSTPDHASPYSPSSRLFLNPMYLDVEAIAEFADCAAAQAIVGKASFAAELRGLRAEPMVDYLRVAAAKAPVLERLYACFRARKAGERRVAAFEKFCAERGEPLQRFALYEALHEHFRRKDTWVGSWQQWPEAYHSPESDAVREFARKNKLRVGYFLYLQWQAALQLAAASAACRGAHTGIGLFLDLAVSINRGGADAWSQQALYALRASIGAPPDDFNPNGQDWGLPPCNPEAMRRTGYASFIQTLRANMASAGALRIDHVLGLARLFWLPLEGRGSEGAYVRYPLADLLGIIALESERHRCMVVGEDLGTVPVQLRHALREWGVLSYRLLMFERDSAGRFNAASEYPIQSMVAFSTHDLPTFIGYWQKLDAAGRSALLAALRGAGLLPHGVGNGKSVPDDSLPHESLVRLGHAVHLYLARSRALMLSVQIDDVAGAAEQANVPGTPDAAPNWRRKLPVSIEAMRSDRRFQEAADELCAARGARAVPAG